VPPGAVRGSHYQTRNLPLHDDFDIEMAKALESEVSIMCNLSKGVEEKGINIGVERQTLLSVQNLMETLKLTAEQAMAALKIPESKCPKYADMMDIFGEV